MGIGCLNRWIREECVVGMGDPREREKDQLERRDRHDVDHVFLCLPSAKSWHSANIFFSFFFFFFIFLYFVFFAIFF